mmetsp:Transcript_27167/g.90312  ORF Transcript_27167/g.90312 Transcript_27167/m.90312 type:complete len:315 (+) Transcript_27167:2684-3628(+)
MPRFWDCHNRRVFLDVFLAGRERAADCVLQGVRLEDTCVVAGLVLGLGPIGGEKQRSAQELFGGRLLLSSTSQERQPGARDSGGLGAEALGQDSVARAQLRPSRRAVLGRDRAPRSPTRRCGRRRQARAPTNALGRKARHPRRGRWRLRVRRQRQRQADCRPRLRAVPPDHPEGALCDQHFERAGPTRGAAGRRPAPALLRQGAGDDRRELRRRGGDLPGLRAPSHGRGRGRLRGGCRRGERRRRRRRRGHRHRRRSARRAAFRQQDGGAAGQFCSSFFRAAWTCLSCCDRRLLLRCFGRQHGSRVFHHRRHGT